MKKTKVSLNTRLYFPDGRGSATLDLIIEEYEVMVLTSGELRINKNRQVIERYKGAFINKLLKRLASWVRDYGTKPT